MVSAARHGDVSSMIFLAKAFDSGLNLGKDRSQSYSQAIDWYQKAVKNGAEKRYLLMARMAEIMMMEDSGNDKVKSKLGRILNVNILSIE